MPQGYISGDQAAEACLDAGKYRYTDREWLRACRGPDERTYPYGDEPAEGVCNDHRDVHPAVQYFGSAEAWIFSHIDNPCLNQLPESLDPTGARPECVTAEGLYDMMGNLHEWTADPAGTFRGGYYMDTAANGLAATVRHDAGQRAALGLFHGLPLLCGPVKHREAPRHPEARRPDFG